MKNRVLALLCAVFLTLGLAACQKSVSNEGAAATQGSQAAGPAPAASMPVVKAPAPPPPPAGGRSAPEIPEAELAKIRAELEAKSKGK